MKFNKYIIGLAALVGLAVIATAIWQDQMSGEEASAPQSSAAQVASTNSATLNGRELYQQNCASCHGEQANGTENGPPFLHKVYVPSHHSDAAFLLAVKRGVRAHHWNFGDMPPVPGVSEDEAKAITKYVRQLQRTVGFQ
ncbi:c-type cytochrome [Sneathiella limimaris]|uniref:c-type cytochrome n=1 Tax=Sneathiella limimaris TaxID=1964213 RepID=UPI00146BD1CF|nr:cytochrome c [Sneathiella limimaris]